MVHSIDEDLVLDTTRVLVKQMSLITDILVNTENQLVFNFSDDTQVIINLKEVVRSY